MEQWFNRNYRWATWLAVSVPTVYALFVQIPRGATLFQCMAPVMAVALITVIFSTVCLRREGREVLHQMEDLCDPEPMLEFCRGEQKVFDPKGKSRRAMAINLRLNEVAALLGLGRYREGETALEGLETRVGNNPVARFTYLVDMVGLRSHQKRLTEAVQFLTEAEKLRTGMRLPPALARSADCLLEMDRCNLELLERGAQENLEKRYEALLDQAASLRHQVHIHLSLGHYYQLKGERSNAIHHLRFVREHGNKLFAREEADRLLQELQG